MKVTATLVKFVTVTLDVPKAQTDAEIEKVQNLIKEQAEELFSETDSIVHTCSVENFIE